MKVHRGKLHRWNKRLWKRENLIGWTMIILREIEDQIKQSRKAWEESASWQAPKTFIEKQKDNQFPYSVIAKISSHSGSSF